MSAALKMQREKPQKVRQVVVPHGLDSLFTGPVVPAGAIPAGNVAALELSVVSAAGAAAASDSPAPAADGESAGRDLPRFSRDRSLRRQLDAAFESCHRSTMAGWFEGLLQGLLRK